jgi:hypothetical protein
MPERKPTYPGIPPVINDQILAPTVRSLVEVVELLTGQRGDKSLALPSNLQSWMADVERRLRALGG